MGTIPVLPTFTAGQILTAANLAAINAVVDFWAAPPRCLVYKSNTQALTSTTTPSLVTWDSELYDTDGCHDTATNNSRVYAKTPGYYRVSALATFTNNSSGSGAIMLRKNAGGVWNAGTELTEIVVDAPTSLGRTPATPLLTVPLAVDDYIEAFAWQDSGVSLSLLTGYHNCFLQIELAGKV